MLSLNVVCHRDKHRSAGMCCDTAAAQRQRKQIKDEKWMRGESGRGVNRWCRGFGLEPRSKLWDTGACRQLRCICNSLTNTEKLMSIESVCMYVYVRRLTHESDSTCQKACSKMFDASAVRG